MQQACGPLLQPGELPRWQLEKVLLQAGKGQGYPACAFEVFPASSHPIHPLQATGIFQDHCSVIAGKWSWTVKNPQGSSPVSRKAAQLLSRLDGTLALWMWRSCEEPEVAQGWCAGRLKPSLLLLGLDPHLPYEPRGLGLRGCCLTVTWRRRKKQHGIIDFFCLLIRKVDSFSDHQQSNQVQCWPLLRSYMFVALSRFILHFPLLGVLSLAPHTELCLRGSAGACKGTEWSQLLREGARRCFLLCRN